MMYLLASGERRAFVAALVAALIAVAPASAGDCHYAVDDGTVENAVGLNTGDFFWCNEFEAGECLIIEAIQVAFGPVVSGGGSAPVRLFVYQNTGHNPDPRNAVLVATTSGMTMDEDAGVLNTYVLDTPVMVGGTFYVGAAVDGMFPAAIDQDSTYAGVSWAAFNLTNADDPLQSPGTLELVGDLGLPGNWNLRAVGSSDLAAVECPADTNGDLDVNVTDLVNVILHWGTDGIGPDGLNADVHPDGTVNAADLARVVSTWGVCPSNDDWENATLIEVTLTHDPISLEFSMDGMTVQEDVIQPSCAKDITRDTWFRINEISSLSGIIMTTEGSDFDSVLEAFVNHPVGAPPVQSQRGRCNDDVGQSGQWSSLGPCLNDVLVRVGAKGDGGGTGVLNLRIGVLCEAFGECGFFYDPGPNPFNVIPGFTNRPEGFLCIGPDIIGTLGTWTGIIGTGNELTVSLCTSNNDIDTGLVVFCGDCVEFGCVTSNEDGCGVPGGHASATFCTEPGVNYPVLIYHHGGYTNESFEVTVTEGPPCSDAVCEEPIFDLNDDCADAQPVTDGITPYVTLQTTTDGPAHPGCETGQDDGVTVNDVWFSYVASGAGTLRVSTCGELGGLAAHDSDIVVYDSSMTGGSACDDLFAAFAACNDDDPDRPCGAAPAFQSTVEFPVEAGVEYLIRVGDWADGHRGYGLLSIELLFP